MIALPNDWRAYIALTGALIALYMVTRGEVAKGVSAVAGAVNPFNRDNVFYGAAEQFGAIVTDTPIADFSLGAWIWEKTHAEQVRLETAAPVLSDAPDYYENDLMRPYGWDIPVYH